MLNSTGLGHHDIVALSPEKRREIVHKLNIQKDEHKSKEPKKKLTMDEVHGTIKADAIFGGITYSKEKQLVSHDEDIYM
jgi:hypothetical protein